MKRVHLHLAALLLAVSLTSGCFGNHSPAKANNYLDDKVITERVVSKLHQPKNNGLQDVQVTTTNGVVYLSGSVASAQQKAEAGKLAEQVHRAGEVENGIEVQGGTGSNGSSSGKSIVPNQKRR